MLKILAVGAAASILASSPISGQQPASQNLTPGPGQAAQATDATPPIQPVSNPRIVMLRWYVADLERATRFYTDVFGMIAGQRMGDKVRIMVFPGGGIPGLILIQSPDEARMNGSFVIQVADVQATLAKAKASGATLMNTNFAQEVQEQAARSSHFADSDGNIVEVLQIGGPPKK